LHPSHATNGAPSYNYFFILILNAALKTRIDNIIKSFRHGTKTRLQIASVVEEDRVSVCGHSRLYPLANKRAITKKEV